MASRFEYRSLTVPRHAGSQQTSELLAIHAEYGDWELARHAVYADGRRAVTVRRRLRPEPLPPLMS